MRWIRPGLRPPRIVTRATVEAQRHERLLDVSLRRWHVTVTPARRMATGAPTLAQHMFCVAAARAVVVALCAERRVIVVTEIVGVIVNDVRTEAAVKMHPRARTRRWSTVKERGSRAYVILRGTSIAARQACKTTCCPAAAAS